MIDVMIKFDKITCKLAKKREIYSNILIINCCYVYVIMLSNSLRTELEIISARD